MIIALMEVYQSIKEKENLTKDNEFGDEDKSCPLGYSVNISNHAFIKLNSLEKFMT